MILKLLIITHTGKLKWKCVNNLKNSIFNKLYMSGSAALSAAKNRRTATAPPAPGNYKPTQQNNETANAQQIEVPKNPLQILYMHELRLNKLETVKPDTVKSVPNNEGLIISLTEKIALLEKQCSELKDELNKIMSFTMETNRAFLLYKNDTERQLSQQKSNEQSLTETS